MTSEDRFNPDGSAANPWKLCSIQQVEEVKCLLRVIPIWVACILYYISIIQQQTYVVFQALQSDRRFSNTNFKIPAATYIGFSMLSLSIWIPIYDRIIIPFLRKLTKKEDGITVLQKIGVGLVLSAVTMFISAFVENQRRITANTKPIIASVPRKGVISAMSGSWLIPQLAVAGISEAFTVIGQVEFYYKQFPENMRSFGGSFLFCGIAMSSYLSSFLISIVHRVTANGGGGGNWLAEDLNKGRLDYFYYMVAGLEVLNLGYFLVCAKWYKYKGTGSNTLDVAMENVRSDKIDV